MEKAIWRRIMLEPYDYIADEFGPEGIAAFHAMQKDAHIPERYKKARLTEEQTWDIDDPKESMYMEGNVGSGKTYALCGVIHSCIALDIYEKTWPKPSYRFVSVPELFCIIRGTFEKDSPKKESDIILEFTKRSQFLFLDDLGAEKRSPWTEETLYLILNWRYANCKHFTISSNLSMAGLRKSNERLGSRVQENCRLVSVKGRDRRSD